MQFLLINKDMLDMSIISFMWSQQNLAYTCTDYFIFNNKLTLLTISISCCFPPLLDMSGIQRHIAGNVYTQCLQTFLN